MNRKVENQIPYRKKRFIKLLFRNICIIIYLSIIRKIEISGNGPKVAKFLAILSFLQEVNSGLMPALCLCLKNSLVGWIGIWSRVFFIDIFFMLWSSLTYRSNYIFKNILASKLPPNSTFM